MSDVKNILRGDIFWIEENKTCGNVQMFERPVIIVSNNMNNRYSDCVEIVYLTSQKKKDLPTHVKVMCKIPSTALCERVCTISKQNLGNFIRSCTDQEMKQVDRALKISLDL